MALSYNDYLKIRNAQVGEQIILSTGKVVVRETAGDVQIGRVRKPTKNTNLDRYDGTYIG